MNERCFSHCHSCYSFHFRKKKHGNKEEQRSIKWREIRLVEEGGFKKREAEEDVGRRTEPRRAASTDDQLRRIPPAPFSSLLSRPKQRDGTGSCCWRETPANRTSSSLAVWNAVRRSFDNASGNPKSLSGREHLHSPRERCALKFLSLFLFLSFSLSLFRVLSRSQIHPRIYSLVASFSSSSFRPFFIRGLSTSRSYENPESNRKIIGRRFFREFFPF